MIDKIFSFLRRYSLGRIKIMLFTILIGGLLLDFKTSFDWSETKKHFEVVRGNLPDNTITFSLIGLFVFMIVIDFIDHNRKRKVSSQLIALLESKDVSEETKEKILEKVKI